MPGVRGRATCDVRNSGLVNCRHQSRSRASGERYLEPSPRQISLMSFSPSPHHFHLSYRQSREELAFNYTDYSCPSPHPAVLHAHTLTRQDVLITNPLKHSVLPFLPLLYADQLFIQLFILRLRSCEEELQITLQGNVGRK